MGLNLLYGRNHIFWRQNILNIDNDNKEEEIIDEGDSDEDAGGGSCESCIDKTYLNGDLLFEDGDSNQTNSQRSICEHNCG